MKIPRRDNRRPDEKEAEYCVALTKSTSKNQLPEVKRNNRLHELLRSAMERKE
ncbi:MAG TPA: hypothetical protein VFJ55_05595 [Chthoniobacterales bacterium]|nr:hypothetical protein [Chthoniobacterales bacterium]